MGKWQLKFVVLVSLVGLSACSLFDEKEGGPAPLGDITQRVEIKSRWSANVGSGLSSTYRIIAPVVDADTVYANDYKGRVYAFDKDSGDRKWRKNLKLDVAAGVGLAGNIVFIASLNGDVVALNKDDGELLWQVNVTSEVLAPPQSNGSIVIIQTNDGKLLGLDIKTGEPIWSYTNQLPLLTLRGTATPIVFGPNVVTGFANGKLLALSAVDGTPFWERRIARPQGKSDIERVVDIDGSPVLSNQLIYSSSYNGTLTALTPQGEVVWSQTNSSYSSPVVIDNKVVVSSAEGYMKAFSADTGFLIWESTLLSGRKLAAPQSLAGFVVTADFEGYIHIFDTESGSLLDRYRIDSDGVRSPMVSDGEYLYVLGNDGELASIAVHLIKP